MEELYNIDDLFVGNLIKEGAKEDVVARNNIFIKKEDGFFSPITGKGFDNLAIQKGSICSFRKKFKKALKVQGIKSMQLTKEQIKSLQDRISIISGNNEMDYIYLFCKFVSNCKTELSIEHGHIEETEEQEY